MNGSLHRFAEKGYRSAARLYRGDSDRSADSMSIERCLQASCREYTFLRDQAIWAGRNRNPDLAMRLFSAAASFATHYHPGFFVDPVAEKELLSIGQSVDCDESAGSVDTTRRGGERETLLHVLSEVSQVGGIWRTLIHWIRHDTRFSHSIVVLRQRDPDAVAWFHGQLEGFVTEVIELDPDSNLLSRAMELRSIARRGFSGCVVHVGQAESIPTVAFAVDDCPPVMLVDHADHSFWLGVAVSDIIVHQRPVGAELCRERRGARACFVLPIPLRTQEPETASDVAVQVDSRRAAARSELGLEDDQIMALTIGRRDKYRPLGDKNFFREAIKLVDAHPRLVLHVVGVDEDQARRWSGVDVLSEQLILHGEVPVEARLYRAADLYLESYPFGSQTAFLEAAQAGMAAVRAPVDTRLLATSDAAIDDCIDASADERAYWERAAYLLGHPAERQHVASRIRNNVVAIHTNGGWREYLSELYERLDRTNHEPRATGTVPTDVTDGHDVALHEWQRWRGDKWTEDRVLHLNTKSFINDVMSRQLHCDDVHLLPSLAWHSLLAGRVDRTIAMMGWRSFVKRVSRLQSRRKGAHHE